MKAQLLRTCRVSLTRFLSGRKASSPGQLARLKRAAPLLLMKAPLLRTCRVSLTRILSGRKASFLGQLARLKRAAPLLFDLLGLCLIAWAWSNYHHAKRAPAQTLWRTVIGGREIFRATVEPDTLVIMAAWEPTNSLWKTQTVVYTTVKNMQKYIEQPIDNYGWVWYYTDGRKLCEAESRPATTSSTNSGGPGYPGVTER